MGHLPEKWVLLVGDPVRGVKAYTCDGPDDERIERRFGNETFYPVKVEDIDAPELILERAKELMEGRSFDLLYIHHDEELTPEQVTLMLQGVGPYDQKAFTDIEEAESEQRVLAARDILREMLGDDDFAILERDGDALDEARWAVEERSDTDLVTKLLKNTRSMLVRYDLGVSVDTTWSSDEEERQDQVADILEALGLPADHELGPVMLANLPNAGYGGRLWAIWYADVADLEKKVRPYQAARYTPLPAPTADITFTGMDLLVLDRLNGSGCDLASGVTFRVPFDASKLVVDTSERMSWTSIAGVVASAYTGEATMPEPPVSEEPCPARNAYDVGCVYRDGHDQSIFPHRFE